MDLQRYYEKVARKHGVSVAEVKREITLAIQEAWQNAAANPQAAAFQKQVHKVGDIPTDEEVILFITRQVLGHDDCGKQALR